MQRFELQYVELYESISDLAVHKLLETEVLVLFLSVLEVSAWELINMIKKSYWKRL